MSITKAIGIVAALALGGAVVHGAQAKQFTTDAPEQTIAAGSIGGSWFIIITAFFDLFSKNIDGLRYTIMPGGAVANPIAVSQGMATLAMGYTSMLHAANKGEAPFPAPLTELRGIANINVTGVIHSIVLASSGLNSLKDLAALQYPFEVDTGPRGTGGELAAAVVAADVDRAEARAPHRAGVLEPLLRADERSVPRRSPP